MLPTDMKGRDFLRVRDWNADDLDIVLDLAAELKAGRDGRDQRNILPGRTLGMIFEKPSTRTRVSFEVGIAELGGLALDLSTSELHVGRGEPIRDTALVLSRYLDAIVLRTYRQADVEELALHAGVPVINGLSDEFHPCQALADLLTISERLGGVSGVRVAYVGDGNNVCHSLLTACALLGAHVAVATPPGYEPDAGVVAFAREVASGALEVGTDPDAAVEGADVLYTDTWTSMGQEEERDRRLAAFAGYAVDERLLARAADRAIVMHCLPAHAGEEIAAEVLYGPRSAVWDQAENRLHAQKALLALIVP